MQKLKSIMIKLISSAGTGYFYPARKNPTTLQYKLAFMKVSAFDVGEGDRYADSNRFVFMQYDPIVRQHVLFTETKMPKGRGGRRAGKK